MTTNLLQRLQKLDENEAIVKDIAVSQGVKRAFADLHPSTNPYESLLLSVAHTHNALQNLFKDIPEQRLPLVCSSCGEASVMFSRTQNITSVHCKHCGKKYLEVDV
jgi:DNA-directed RNA polymerase subunit RPC12/RpoP